MTRKLAAFFYYYGAKNGLALRYPAPEYRTVIEPFAGSASYSLAYHDRDVRLFDLDERVCGVWDYLIRAPSSEILALPDLDEDAAIDTLPVCQEARWLIGWCLGQASASGPQAKWTAWGWGNRTGERTGTPRPGDVAKVWSALCKQKLARQQRYIRHWQITNAPWIDAPSMPATYFVDPPYEVAGKHYRHSDVDYAALGAWCRASTGHVIACEADGATWLPFRPLTTIASQGRTGEKKGSGRAKEVVWTNRELTRGRQTQWLDMLDPEHVGGGK